MIQMQKFEITKMVLNGAKLDAVVTSAGDSYQVRLKVILSGKDANTSTHELSLVTQKGRVKQFKVLESVRSFMFDVGIPEFKVQA